MSSFMHNMYTKVLSKIIWEFRYIKINTCHVAGYIFRFYVMPTQLAMSIFVSPYTYFLNEFGNNLIVMITNWYYNASSLW